MHANDFSGFKKRIFAFGEDLKTKKAMKTLTIAVVLMAAVFLLLFVGLHRRKGGGCSGSGSCGNCRGDGSCGR